MRNPSYLKGREMRSLLLSTALIAGVIWAGLVPAKASPLTMPGINSEKLQAAPIEKVGYRRRFYRRSYRRSYRRYGYPGPVYYPRASYGYYPPPPAYGYYAPYPRRYAPHGYHRPYYAPY
jgi:hypothetical protein